tara:strand:- start:108 stop:779 length:672 start_codon:yes stop_codon:yes gene_type:complete
MLAIFANCAGTHAITNETEALLEGPIKKFKDKFKTFEKTNIKLIVEKTPRHIHRLDQITSDKDASALIMLRNPVDVVASLKKRGFSLSQSIQRYKRDNTAWLDYASSENIQVVKYEALVQKTNAVLKILRQTYGVDLISANKKRLSDKRVYFTQHGATKIDETDGKGHINHLALRNFQIRQTVTNMNGLWRDRLTSDELAIVIQELRVLISKFDYEECFDYKI